MNIKSWISAIRLRTLPLSLSCILMGGALANTFTCIDVVVFMLVIRTTILLQILSNLANDYGDGIKGTDDQRVGPDRMIQKGYLSENELVKAIYFILLINHLNII